jgi:hypothetical protein
VTHVIDRAVKVAKIAPTVTGRDEMSQITLERHMFQPPQKTITLKLYDRFGEFSHAPKYDQPEYSVDQVREIAKGWISKGGSHAVITDVDGKIERVDSE